MTHLISLDGRLAAFPPRLREPRRFALQSFGGAMVDLLAPDLRGVSIHDIAGALAMLPRWCGQLRRFYSVAQHSLHVARLVEIAGGDRTAAAYALAHDASEALTGDLPTPLKLLLGPPWQAIEQRLQHATCIRLGLPGWPPPADIARLIEQADAVAAATECRDLRAGAPPAELLAVTPDAALLAPMDPVTATLRWLQAARHYGML